MGAPPLLRAEAVLRQLDGIGIIADVAGGSSAPGGGFAALDDADRSKELNLNLMPVSRPGIGSTYRRCTPRRAGRAQETSSQQAEETPFAGPGGCSVCLVSKVGGPGVLRPDDGGMLSWGLKSPRIVQEGLNEATILSLVSTGLGVGWVLGSARWRSPATVVILPVADLNVTLRLALVWRRDNTSPLLARFIGEVEGLPDVRALNKG
jgi:LysR substrate binding domain